MTSTEKPKADLSLGAWDVHMAPSSANDAGRAFLLVLACICQCFPQSLALIFGSKLQSELSFLASGVLLMSIWPELTNMITT